LDPFGIGVDMRKRIISLLVGLGIITSPISLLPAEEIHSSSEQDCPSCPSFGVLRIEKEKAPLFSLKDLDGNKVALKDLKGKPVILTFWATWCPPCKKELPTLAEFAKMTKDQLIILAIDIGEDQKTVRRFVEANKIDLRVLLDERKQFSRAYGAIMIPTTILIDKEGMMVGKIVGERDWSTQEAWSAMRELFGLH
jgi:thiol-disulfide isomerase/thioredoxin